MNDVSLQLDDRPGALAEMGAALAARGISIEGGGVFVHENRGVAHFLFEDGEAAARVLREVGIRVLEVSEVVAVRLRQDEAGQLGKLCRRMADAGVNIRTQYSDHDHQLILVVDDVMRARVVADDWMRVRRESRP